MRTRISDWWSNLVLGDIPSLVLVSGESSNPFGGGPKNITEATSEQIRSKQDELDHHRKLVEWEQEKREWLNNEHSTAGDDGDSELEKQLGNKLENIDNKIEKMWDYIGKLIEWFSE